MKTILQKNHHSVEKGVRIEWIHVRHPSPQGLILVPPLIGGNLSQQVHTFRRIVHSYYDLISFNYSGHGDSSDKFSLGATLRDTAQILRRTLHLADRKRLPLYAIASCYSAIPTLFAAYQTAEPFRGIVLINPLPMLSPRAVFNSFIDHYYQLFSLHGTLPGVLLAADQYLEKLFPQIVRSKDHFGALKRKRARVLKTLSEFLTINPLDRVHLKRTPVLCLYAKKDSILKIFHAGRHTSYENNIRAICPHTRFYPVEADHFFSPASARQSAFETILNFIDPNSQSANSDL
jgi:pimeloyl-ACP methyl ester carboxylesterase